MKDTNHIDRLEQDLYSRKFKNEPHDDRSPVTPGELEVTKDWSDSERVEDLIRLEHEKKQEDKSALFKKILLGSIVFCILAIGLALFMFFGGGNLVSADNINIQVVGPANISGGEELSLDLVIQNNNRANLEGVTLLVEYPEGSRMAGNVSTPLERERQVIGTVPARGEVRKTVKSVLFGEKESIKEISISLEYRIEGSSATFFKDKKYEVAIKSSPVIVTIKNPSEINSNQEIEFIIDIASNSGEILKNILLKAEYPFGFSFLSADPKPIRDNALWNIGDLSPNEKHTIRIKGKLQGQNDEERTFRFSTGIANPEKQEELGAVFSLLSQPIKIRKPFLAVDLVFAGRSGTDPVYTAGEKVQTNIIWTNNLPTQLVNGKIEVKLSGVFDKSSVTVFNGGYYRSLDSTIVWDKISNNDLVTIEPGERGVVSFSFSSLKNIAATSVNQQMGVNVSVSANQINDLGKPEIVKTDAGNTVKLSSNTNLTTRSVRSIGPFENSGPIPPRADQETTYTIIWSLTNSFNTLSQAKVQSELPPNAKWTGLTDPAIENVTFDSNTHQIVWNVGDLRSGTGLNSEPRQVAFQISIEPSLSQVGDDIVLLGPSYFSADDRYTGKQIQFNVPSVTSRFATDPMYREGEDKVVK